MRYAIANLNRKATLHCLAYPPSIRSQGLFCVGDNSIFGVIPLFLPLAIAAFEDPEGYSSLAIITFGAFEFIAPKHENRKGEMDKRSLNSLI